MLLRLLLAVVVAGLFSGCARESFPPASMNVPDRPIDYVKEVQPVLVKRCVVCHSCYNSPCQLKLSSFEGLDRGATKKKVYDAARLQTMEPTRLFMDAQSTAEWREKGFHSVVTPASNTCSVGCEGTEQSLMGQMLAWKQTNPMKHADVFEAEAEDLTCATDGKELDSFLKKHPNRGMPFGFPPLTQEEFDIVGGWLAQGAPGPTEAQTEVLLAIPQRDQEKISKWETFLNRPEPKYAMTARYLYEHLFLAHLSFETPENQFYELVRSTTAPGRPIDIIASELPYDDPGVSRVYYRFRKIHSTIVHKTHMVFSLSDAQYDRFHELFIDPEWLLMPQQVGYQKEIAANPFRAFEQIPVRSRYQFLLDNIHYIIMTFIRGPVCKGQVALNVVRDHFWLLFMDPDHDLSVQYPGFLQTYDEMLEMPLVEENDLKLAKTLFTRKYRHKSSDYVKQRAEFYAMNHYYKPLGAEAIWKGNRAEDSPLLTVFRHFDSASVHRGPLGYLPRTIWVMDYPLVERIYYSLVAGFNVYGTAMHQLTIRVYMDELRQEGETYFLDFMPKEQRRSMMKDWYGGMELDSAKLDYTPSQLESGFAFHSAEPKREFVEHLVDHHFLPEANIGFDLNYLRATDEQPVMPASFTSYEDYIQGFRAVSRPGVSFFTTVDDHNANLAYIRIMVNDRAEDDVYVSLVINRYHDDVTTLFGEELRLRPEKDRAVFLRGFVGSYPNYFFEVPLAELPAFLNVLETFNPKDEHAVQQLSRFGVNRAADNFWEVYDRFQARFNEDDPFRAGLFDLNRYYKLALKKDQL